MTLTEWFIFFLIVQVIHFLGTWKLYVKAGRKAWEALVPVYNAVILMKIINRPWWWVILLFIPVINVIMLPVLWVETIRSFGQNTTKDTILVVVTLGFYIFYVNYMLDVKYIEDRDLKPTTASGEWTSSILFAVVAATIVHTYFMQPYTIPTGSLERTLLVGDFLFVSKFHYGARTPMTAVSFPMVHDTIPVVRKKSYLSKPQYPYFRLPGFQKVKRNDIVVFSWPVDTVSKFRDQSNLGHYKPIDKKSNYVKRCVGVPGDSLAVIDGYVHINGQKNQLPDRAQVQFSYEGTVKNRNFNPQNLYNRYKIKPNEFGFVSNTEFRAAGMTNDAAKQFKNHPNVSSIQRSISPKGQKEFGIFPNNGKVNWNRDNFGAIYIPEAGKTVKMDLKSFSLYRRIIEVYEGSELGIDNKLSVNGTQILLNGKPIDSYTFKQDYYWMMGDNRHNSEDSRAWGYVPANHIVGKPVFVWFSWDTNAKGLFNKIRWERMFTTVGGSGKSVSYFKYFLILLIGWIIYGQYRKRKKNA
ncbi:signal peptidase I [Aquimarina sp. AD10]|uniref:signal peptidase I n=1 Tax=Aquimarina sp. AD10 TaxID=1714849 RepID=UPI000E4961AB|nr:signal peptidase I [Aquimarina sp. AD10]AXT60451.1 signal peptidase I [Aquimarina sp. AD10]RKM96936.1 signal peptidase I [Aquimarina sp. AD10]